MTINKLYREIENNTTTYYLDVFFRTAKSVSLLLLSIWALIGENGVLPYVGQNRIIRILSVIYIMGEH